MRYILFWGGSSTGTSGLKRRGLCREGSKTQQCLILTLHTPHPVPSTVGTAPCSYVGSVLCREVPRHTHIHFIYTCMCTYIQYNILYTVHTYIHTYIHTYVHMYAHIHTYIHIYIHTYVCTGRNATVLYTLRYSLGNRSTGYAEYRMKIKVKRASCHSSSGDGIRICFSSSLLWCLWCL